MPLDPGGAGGSGGPGLRRDKTIRELLGSGTEYTPRGPSRPRYIYAPTPPPARPGRFKDDLPKAEPEEPTPFWQGQEFRTFLTNLAETPAGELTLQVGGALGSALMDRLGAPIYDPAIPLPPALRPDPEAEISEIFIPGPAGEPQPMTLRPFQERNILEQIAYPFEALVRNISRRASQNLANTSPGFGVLSSATNTLYHGVRLFSKFVVYETLESAGGPFYRGGLIGQNLYREWRDAKAEDEQFSIVDAMLASQDVYSLEPLLNSYDRVVERIQNLKEFAGPRIFVDEQGNQVALGELDPQARKAWSMGLLPQDRYLGNEYYGRVLDTSNRLLSIGLQNNNIDAIRQAWELKLQHPSNNAVVWRATWGFHDEGSERYDAAMNAVAAATLQIGRWLEPWEVDQITSVFVDPGTELAFEVVADPLNLIPGEVFLKPIKWFGEPLVDLTTNLPLIKQTLGWLNAETLMTTGSRLGRQSHEALGIVARSSGTISDFQAALIRIANGDIPTHLGLQPRQLDFLLGEAGLAGVVDPSDWAKMLDQVGDDMYEEALEIFAKNHPNLPDGEIEALARAFVNEPENLVRGLSEYTTNKFLSEHRLWNSRHLDEGAIAWFGHKMGLDEAARGKLGLGRHHIIGVLDLAQTFKGLWIGAVLHARPGFTVINYVDSSFRALLGGADPWTDMAKILDEVAIPQDLATRFANAEIGRMDVAGAILDGRKFDLGLLGVFAEGLTSINSKNPFSRLFGGLKAVNTAFETTWGIRLYYKHFTNSFNVLERAALEALPAFSDDATRQIAAQIWLDSHYTPAKIQETVSRMVSGEITPGTPVWSYLSPEGSYEELATMLRDPAAARAIHVEVGNSLNELVQAGELTQEQAATIFDDLIADTNQAMEDHLAHIEQLRSMDGPVDPTADVSGMDDLEQAFAVPEPAPSFANYPDETWSQLGDTISTPEGEFTRLGQGAFQSVYGQEGTGYVIKISQTEDAVLNAQVFRRYEDTGLFPRVHAWGETEDGLSYAIIERVTPVEVVDNQIRLVSDEIAQRFQQELPARRDQVLALTGDRDVRSVRNWGMTDDGRFVVLDARQVDDIPEQYLTEPPTPTIRQPEVLVDEVDVEDVQLPVQETDEFIQQEQDAINAQLAQAELPLIEMPRPDENLGLELARNHRRLADALSQLRANPDVPREAVDWIGQLSSDSTLLVSGPMHRFMLEVFPGPLASTGRARAARWGSFFRLRDALYGTMGGHLDEALDVVRQGNFDELARRWATQEFPSAREILENSGWTLGFDETGNLTRLKFEGYWGDITDSQRLDRFQGALGLWGEEELSSPFIRQVAEPLETIDEVVEVVDEAGAALDQLTVQEQLGANVGPLPDDFSTNARDFIGDEYLPDEGGKLYHTTTNRDAVLAEGLRPRSETGTIGLGGGPSGFKDQNLISTTYSYNLAAQIQERMQLAVRAARGEATADDVIEYFSQIFDTADDFGRPLGIEVEDIYDWEAIENWFSGITPEELYETIRDLDAGISDYYTGFDPSYSSIGLTGTVDEMRRIDPDQIEILEVAGRRGTQPDWGQDALELTFKPEDVWVVHDVEVTVTPEVANAWETVFSHHNLNRYFGWRDNLDSFDDFMRYSSERIEQAIRAGDMQQVNALRNRVNTIRQEYQALLVSLGEAAPVAQLPPRARLPYGFQTYLEAGEQALQRRDAIVGFLQRWQSWLDGQIANDTWKVAGLTETQADELLAWASEATNVKQEIIDIANYGGTFGKYSFDGAVPITNKHLIDYSNVSRFDRMMKQFYPFWMFPSRSLPFWAETMVAHPQIASYYFKYLDASERQSYQLGATTSAGDQLPSLRGYIKVPGTEYWFNPTAPLSFRYVFPRPNLNWDDESGALTPGERVFQYIYEWGTLYGFNPPPWITWFAYTTGLLDENKVPRWSTIPQSQLIPSWTQRSILEGLRRLGFTNAPDTWSPEVSWKDYLIEREVLQLSLQQMETMPDPQARALAALTEAALDPVQRAENPEAMRLWEDARHQIEQFEYYRTVFGYFTGVYGKEHTDADAELLRLRDEVNLLKSSINDRTQAEIFGLYADSQERYRKYIDLKFGTPQGTLYELYGNIRWTRTPEGKQLYGDDRRALVSQRIYEDNVTEAYYQSIQVAKQEMEAALAALPVGADYDKYIEPILSEYFSTLDQIDNDPMYEVARRAWVAGYKPSEMLYEQVRDRLFWMINTTRPAWRAESETYEEYQARYENWLNNIPMYMQPALGGPDFPFLRNIQAEVQEVIEGVQVPEQIPEDFLNRLIAEVTPENFEAWQLGNDSIHQALDKVWRDNYWSVYWQMVSGKSGAERELAEREFLRLFPEAPSTQQLVEWVQETYGGQFRPGEIIQAVESGVLDIQERLEQSRGELFKYQEGISDALMLIGPGANYGEFLDAYVREGGSEGDLDTLYNTYFDPEAWGDIEEYFEVYHRIQRVIAQLNPPYPTDEQLAERVEAQALNDRFKEQAAENFGEDVFTLERYYFALNSKEQEAYEEFHPREFGRIQDLWNFRDDFALIHQLWAKYYRPKAYNTSGLLRHSEADITGLTLPEFKRYAAQAQRDNFEFRQAVIAELGADFYDILGAYGELSTEERKEWRAKYPEDYAKIKRYYEMKDEFGAQNEEWNQLYNNGASSSASTGGRGKGAASRRSRKGKPGAITTRSGTRMMAMGLRSTYDPAELLVPGRLGKGGYVKFPVGFAEAAGPVLVKEIRTGKISEAGDKFLTSLRDRHPEWFDFIERLRKGRDKSSRKPDRPRDTEEEPELELNLPLD